MTLTLRTLGDPDLPSEVAGFPVFASGQYRQSWDDHIVVGVSDVTAGNFFGYDWVCGVRAYRAWPPGRHGTACAGCEAVADEQTYWAPCGVDCGHLWDGGSFSETWGVVFDFTFDILTLWDRAAGRRFDAGLLQTAIAAAGVNLAALPPNPLTWTAYGPTHDYGRWATREAAAGWLVGHMQRLSKDRNLGAERQQVAADNMQVLASGSPTVEISGKVYGIREQS